MIGLVLAGGGVRGSYHVGAYFALKKCHLKFDGFVGTSIGAFNAAFLAANRASELLKFWQKADIAQIIGFNQRYIDYLHQRSKSTNIFQHLFFNAKDIIKNRGIDNTGVKAILKELNLEADIRKSRFDFGLVTVKAKKFQPVYAFKQDIPSGKLNDYILASCYLPLFKLEKIIDGNYYLDGGFYDNAPANMLLDKGYDQVYVIELSAIGVRRYSQNSAKVIVIKPSRNLKSIFNTNHEDVIYNLKLGYYDTLKQIKRLDGSKYIFKKLPDFIYNLLVRKVDSHLLWQVKRQFKTQTKRELVLKVLEHIMLGKQYDYPQIYNPLKVIAQIKKEKSNFLGYRFIKSLRIF